MYAYIERFDFTEDLEMCLFGKTLCKNKFKE